MIILSVEKKGPYVVCEATNLSDCNPETGCNGCKRGEVVKGLYIFEIALKDNRWRLAEVRAKSAQSAKAKLARNWNETLISRGFLDGKTGADNIFLYE